MKRVLLALAAVAGVGYLFGVWASAALLFLGVVSEMLRGTAKAARLQALMDDYQERVSLAVAERDARAADDTGIDLESIELSASDASDDTKFTDFVNDPVWSNFSINNYHSDLND